MKSVVYTSEGFSFKSLKELQSRVEERFGDADLLLFAVHPKCDLDVIAEDVKLLFSRDGPMENQPPGAGAHGR